MSGRGRTGTRRSRPVLMVLAAIACVAGCAAPDPVTDYRAFEAHRPRSILVLPPLNHTASVEAPDLFLSTVTRPLAERGYYVFPVTVVDRFLRDHGAPTPGEMHQVPLERLGAVFGADAVLLVEIREWTTSYMLLATDTSVELEYRLVDVRSGAVLWERPVRVSNSSLELASGQDPFTLVIAVVAAQVQAIGAMFGDPEIDLARRANVRTFADGHHGLLLGARHPRFEVAHDEEDQLADVPADSTSATAAAGD